MIPTEYLATTAVNAAAKHLWEEQSKHLEEEIRPTWESLDRLTQNQLRQAVLGPVWAALEALPEYPELSLEWGRRIKDDSMDNGHMVGHVTSLFKTREDALGDAGNGRVGLFEDCELVVRSVSPWEPTE